MKIKINQGFTLIDLLMGLGIFALLSGYALPAFGNLIEKNKVTDAVTSLRATLQLARNMAITEHQSVTVCPSNNGVSCQNDWSSGYIAFIDTNHNRQLDQQDSLLYYTRMAERSIQLRWQAFGTRSSLQWIDTGVTNSQNGYFEFCYQDKPKLTRAIIIAKSGRIRISQDHDGDQIQEDANGKNLRC